MKHWLDMSDEERAALSDDEKEECISSTLKFELELLELVKERLCVRYAGLIWKLPLCHDSGDSP
jgi:hypothetical protein